MLPQSKTQVDLSFRQVQILKLFPTFYEVITSNDIEKALKIDRTTAYYHLHGRGKNRGLIGLGLLKIEKGRNPALYGLTVKGTKILRGILRGVLTFNTSDIVHNRKLCVRGHNIRLKSNLMFSDSFNGLNLCRFNNLKVYQLASWEKFEGRFEGDYFCITPNSIIFQPTERYGTPYLALLSVFDSARRLFRLLEEDNPGLRIEEDYSFVTGQEWAFEGDEYAVACVKLGQEFKNARFGIDNSKGKPELEYFDRSRAVDDSTVWKNHVEELIYNVLEKRITVKDLASVQGLRSRVEDIENRAFPLMDTVLDSHEWFNKNMVEHRQILDDIKVELGRLAETNRGPGVVSDNLGKDKPGNTNLLLKSTKLVVKSVYDMNPGELREYWKSKKSK